MTDEPDEEYLEDDDDFGDDSPCEADLAPQRFRFYIGGGQGVSYNVCWLPEIRSLRIRWGGGSVEGSERLYNVTDSQWRVFWHVLDSIEAWKWKPDYSVESCDGTSWTVDIINGSRRVKSEGQNGYPGGDPEENPTGPFNLFLATVNMLCHRDDIR